MYLKKLELSGFKSFPKATVLAFPHKITAIVGPNGSGKSNIAEGIRWVMGEQSMKSLRGKKGEDLIWNGSVGVSRMGKASVTLIFDNKDGKIPLEFEEVSVGRKIFRDGLNEYYLNDSQVRLKDVVELMARIGLGETKHNIISQGEVDRMLLATNRERREMLEEALGLRVYQLKKHETERKCEATENNMKQVEALLREITPHLRFLRSQAEKHRARESIEAELQKFQKIYLAKEGREINEERTRLRRASDPFSEKREGLQKEIVIIIREIQDQETVFAEISAKSAEEAKLIEFEGRRREKERELGRLEGRLEAEKEKLSRPKLRVVDMRYIKDEVQAILSEIRAILEEEDRVEVMRSHLFVLIEDLDSLLIKIERGTAEEARDEGETAALSGLQNAITMLQDELTRIAEEVRNLQAVRLEEHNRYRILQQKLKELHTLLRVKQDQEREVMIELERFRFNEERLRGREEFFSREMTEMGLSQDELASISLAEFETVSSEELKRRIERLRGKLEEIGGIDHTVIKEFEETEARHSFLTRELDDLKKASVSLKELIRELDNHIKNDFREGFAKIKEEFHNYFRIIFGGGKASLQLVEVPLRDGYAENSENQEGDGEKGLSAEGADIVVDLPGKRIKGLAMLSGGERALTSIALLFAITAVSPPPFLVLDETDAALDEANSQRYAAILKELSKRTQLLLVTHNRETMKCAGVLYGVTIGDDGASRLLSLKLEEAEVYTNR